MRRRAAERGLPRAPALWRLVPDGTGTPNLDERRSSENHAASSGGEGGNRNAAPHTGPRWRERALIRLVFALSAPFQEHAGCRSPESGRRDDAGGVMSEVKRSLSDD